MRSVAVLLLSVLLALSCTLRGADDDEWPPIGVGNVSAEIGTYTPDEVQKVRQALARVEFPAEPGTVARLLPRPLKELPVRFVDWVPDQEKKGRVGGMEVDYWLNSDTVLKVATAYYFVDDTPFNREEWAVILTRAERAKFKRPIY